MGHCPDDMAKLKDGTLVPVIEVFGDGWLLTEIEESEVTFRPGEWTWCDDAQAGEPEDGA